MALRLLNLIAAIGGAVAAVEKRPNIVFILADDLGYNEMGFMNSTRQLHTPHLDALAHGGVVLKNYYVQPICSPTRSALMTGRVPIHLGTQANVIYWDTPWAIDLEERFLSENLKDAGYTTAMFGKWHLGMFRESSLPRRRGFDEHMGYYQGCGSEATHIASCCQPGPDVGSGDLDYVCEAPKGEDFRGYDWFKSGSHGGSSKIDFSANRTRSALLIGDAAVEFIGRVGGRAPFFLYLPFQNIHEPYTVEQRFQRFYPTDTFSEHERTVFGYISEMDEQVGRVVDALRSVPSVYENTVIVFSSDNGAPMWTGVRDRNYPFRGAKTTIWEGGTRVPAFVHSPLLPAAVRGTTSLELYHVTDWLPTLVRVAGGSTDRNRKLDGFDIWESLAATEASPRTEVLYNVNPLCSSGQAGYPKAGIRVGKWKLLSWCYDIAGVDGATRSGPVSAPAGKSQEFASGPGLFDLEADPRETTNIAAEEPAVVQELLARLKIWAESSAEPMQWHPPFQGQDYFCKDCPKHPAGTGAFVPWTSWIGEDGKLLDLDGSSIPFADHIVV